MTANGRRGLQRVRPRRIRQKRTNTAANSDLSSHPQDDFTAVVSVFQAHLPMHDIASHAKPLDWKSQGTVGADASRAHSQKRVSSLIQNATGGESRRESFPPRTFSSQLQDTTTVMRKTSISASVWRDRWACLWLLQRFTTSLELRSSLSSDTIECARERRSCVFTKKTCAGISPDAAPKVSESRWTFNARDHHTHPRALFQPRDGRGAVYGRAHL